MCLPIVARILGVEADQAEIELLGTGGGGRTCAGLALYPDAAPGAYVLVDRGLVIELIDEAQAETILGFYAELAELMVEDEEEAGVG